MNYSGATTGSQMRKVYDPETQRWYEVDVGGLDARGNPISGHARHIAAINEAPRFDFLSGYVRTMEDEFKKALLSTITEEDVARLKPRVQDALSEAMDHLLDPSWQGVLRDYAQDALRRCVDQIMEKIVEERLADPVFTEKLTRVAAEIGEKRAIDEINDKIRRELGPDLARPRHGL